MAIINHNGHGITTALPSNADGVQVGSVSMPFQEAPANQSGGPGGPQVAPDKYSSFPPKGAVSSPNVGKGTMGAKTSAKKGVYGA